MRRRLFSILFLVCFLAVSVALGGCTIIFQKGRSSDVETIHKLTSQLEELTAAKDLLAQRLQQEIADKQVSLEMAERGLVITFVSDVLFDSGKAEVKKEAFVSLDKVARVLNENLAEYSVGIEGHTDNVPIQHSNWKSNWELSTARALGVLHYIVDEKGVEGRRVSAIGYGEFHPTADNDTAEGRKLNRRVEVVVLPKVTKVKSSDEASALPALIEPKENLK